MYFVCLYNQNLGMHQKLSPVVSAEKSTSGKTIEILATSLFTASDGAKEMTPVPIGGHRVVVFLGGTSVFIACGAK